MMGLLFLFGCFLALGLFFLAAAAPAPAYHWCGQGYVRHRKAGA